MASQLQKNLDTGYVKVWCDGSCFGNNSKTDKRKAGFGVWFNDNHSWNHCGPLRGDGIVTTNNNAEVDAGVQAVNICSLRGLRHVEIRTDSQLLLNGVAQLERYKQTNYKGVQNHEKFKELVQAINSSKLKIMWEKAEAHKEYGNIEADKLAKKGAELHL